MLRQLLEHGLRKHLEKVPNVLEKCQIATCVTQSVRIKVVIGERFKASGRCVDLGLDMVIRYK